MSGGTANPAASSTEKSQKEPANQPLADERAFEALWQEHADEIYSRCLHLTRGNTADAEEVFSRVSITIYRKLPRYRHNLRDVRAWLLRVTRNSFVDHYREKQRLRETSLSTPPIELGATPFERSVRDKKSNPEAELLSRELREFLLQSIHSLPERLKTTMLEHLRLSNHREIAASLSIKEANARKRVQEARKILRRRLADY